MQNPIEQEAREYEGRPTPPATAQRRAARPTCWNTRATRATLGSKTPATTRAATWTASTPTPWVWRDRADRRRISEFWLSL